MDAEQPLEPVARVTKPSKPNKRAGESSVPMLQSTCNTPQPTLQLPTLPSTAPYVRIDQPTVHPNPQDAREGASCPDHDGSPHRTYLGNTGYMDMFSNPVGWQVTPPNPLRLNCSSELEGVPEDLLDSYVETYFEYASVWCPVFDRGVILERALLASVFIQNAFAFCGTRLRPPLIAHAEPELHYQRAKSLLYGNCESNPLLQIIGVMLFWWGSPGYPNVAGLDTGRWWLGVAIRLAEEIGLHQTSVKVETHFAETPGLRKRIWWTLLTRDRILSMAQGRPCLIHPDYCNVPKVTVADFPDPADSKALIFVHWVSLWEIGGSLHRELYCSRGGSAGKSAVHDKMISWIKSLPQPLHLPFATARTTVFDRDVHCLHLSYLTILIVLYLSRRDHSLPAASLPAIAAASCIARILRDYLARGSVQFVLPQATWSIALAILALLHARHIPGLGAYATEDIKTLNTALTKLAQFSYPGKLFSHGIENLLNKKESAMVFDSQTPVSSPMTDHHFLPPTTVSVDTGTRWMELFPYISPHTSPLIAALLSIGGGKIVDCQLSEQGTPMSPLLQDIVSESLDFFQIHLVI
ncbi:hypothetical protein BDV12DRAFT_199066 [Aspergillus spectabilis]